MKIVEMHCRFSDFSQAGNSLNTKCKACLKTVYKDSGADLNQPNYGFAILKNMPGRLSTPDRFTIIKASSFVYGYYQF